MRLSYPIGPSKSSSRFAPQSDREMVGRQHRAASSSFQLYQQQTNRLNGLYQQSKNRNHRLLQLSLNLSRDLNFLREYCRCLEGELERGGFYKQTEFDRLSRRETAASIFQSYSDSQSLLSGLGEQQNSEEELVRLRSRNSNLEIQNKELHLRVNSQVFLGIHRAVQVDTLDLQRIQREHQIAQERIKQLTTEVGQLRCANGSLELEKRKNIFQTSIWEGSQQIFKRIHQIMRDYRRKVSALAHQKRDIQKSYRLLRDNVRLTETGNQLKLIDLLTEKIDILQKLVEKQQIQIENTIRVYESELSKIEEKRKEQIQFFQSERIDLQSENLRLCIDVQKALNRQDSTNLLLLQQKNASERLNHQVVKLTQNLKRFQSKDKDTRGIHLKLDSGVTKFYGDNFRSQHKIVQSQIFQSVHSAGYNFNDENSNKSNFDYQFSELKQRGALSGQVGDLDKSREMFSRARPAQKIKITYNSYIPFGEYAAPGVHLSQHSNPTRVYDSAVQYKRRFVEKKPDICNYKR